MGANHNFGHKVDDGAGRLFRVVFGEEMAHVFCLALSFPGDKSKDPGGKRTEVDMSICPQTEVTALACGH